MQPSCGIALDAKLITIIHQSDLTSGVTVSTPGPANLPARLTQWQNVPVRVS